MNLADGQRLKGILQGAGYVETADEENADLILFNTCCVREHAEDRLISRVRALQPLKAKRPHLLIGVGGCMAQKEKQHITTLLPVVNVAFGPNDIPHLLDLLKEAAEMKVAFGPFAAVGTFEGEQADGIILEKPFCAYVNIIRGCTNFCSYCIVPHVRGPEVSRPITEIVKFVQDLSEQGVTEITLLGQNVNAYGKDIGIREGFITLLEALQEIAKLRRIRFLTSHPRDFSLSTICRFAKLSKLCEQFHLPVQSGNDRILSLMNRGYTCQTYLALVKEIRRCFPDACLSTDIICGFPSETDEEFEETLALVKEVRFEAAYMYYFSPREGTKAASFEGLLPEGTRKDRLARLIEVQNRIAVEESAKLVGKRFEVLAEAPSHRVKGNLIGKTRTGRIVDFPASESLIGSYVQVDIERARNWTLSGKMTSGKKE